MKPFILKLNKSTKTLKTIRTSLSVVKYMKRTNFTLAKETLDSKLYFINNSIILKSNFSNDSKSNDLHVSQDINTNTTNAPITPTDAAPVLDTTTNTQDLATQFSENVSSAVSDLSKSTKDKDDVPKNTESNSYLDSTSSSGSNPEFKELSEKIDDLISKFSHKDSSESKSNFKTSVSSDTDKLTVFEDLSTVIVSEEQFNLDLILDSKDTQVLANKIFEFYCLRDNMYVIPDITLSHIKSPNNRLALQKLIDYSPYKIEIWREIYKLYFRSLFMLIYQLNPLSLKHIRSISSRLIRNDSLLITPAFNMSFTRDSVPGKIAYGYANGLFDIPVFLSSKFHKIDIHYKFNVENSTIHEITLVWYFIDVNGNERKISKSFESRDLPFESSVITDSWLFNDTNSIFYKHSYKNVFSSLLDINFSQIKFETLQTSSATRMIITSTQDDKAVWTDGFISRSTVNGPVSFDSSNVYLLNSFVSMLNIDNLNIDLEDDYSDEFMQEISIYLGGCIKHFITRSIEPKTLNLKFIDAKFSISKKSDKRSDSELHNQYKYLMRSGDIFPSTPVHFDFYFSNTTIDKFSEFIILSGLSNVSMNMSMKSILPVSDKDSKMNFLRYAKDRSLLSIMNYVTDVSFSFQNIDITLSFDELLVEMYVKTMIMTKVPDYLPLISRGQWSGTDVNSLKLISSHINNILVKFSLPKGEEFIKSIILRLICKFENFTLTKVFKSKTRLVDSCPDIFERFLIEEAYTQNTVPSKYNSTEADYLVSNNIE